MTWRDRRQEASFKGTPFLVDTSEVAGGRRLAVHEFPDADTPNVQDLGRKGRVIAIVAYIVGEDYDLREQELIDRIEDRTPGPLIHPTLGYMFVRCETYRTKLSRMSDGMSEMELTFRVVDPVSVVDRNPRKDTQQDSQDSFMAVSSMAYDSFRSAYAGMQKSPQFLEGVTNGIRQAGEAVRNARKELMFLDEFATQVQEMIASAGSLALDVTQLADTILNIVTLGAYDDTWERVEEALEGTSETVRRTRFYKGMLRGAVALLPFTVESGDMTRNDGVSALQRYVRTCSVAALVAACAQTEFVSAGEAKEFQTFATDALEMFSLELDIPEEMLLVEQARAVIVSDITERSRNLDVLATYQIAVPTASLRLCNDLYGAVRREQDVLDRNMVEDPLFVPAGVPLEVLVRG